MIERSRKLLFWMCLVSAITGLEIAIGIVAKVTSVFGFVSKKISSRNWRGIIETRSCVFRRRPYCRRRCPCIKLPTVFVEDVNCKFRFCVARQYVGPLRRCLLLYTILPSYACQAVRQWISSSSSSSSFHGSSKFVCIYLYLENTGRKRTSASSCHCSRHRSCTGMISFLYLFVRISDSVTKSFLLLHLLLFSFQLGLPGTAGEVGPKGYEVKCLSSPLKSFMNINTCLYGFMLLYISVTTWHTE